MMSFFGQVTRYRILVKVYYEINKSFLWNFSRAGGIGGFEASYTRVTVSDGLELTPNLISTRAEEKAALGGLNDRFVTYIEKVRLLVNRNQALEAKIKQVKL